MARKPRRKTFYLIFTSYSILYDVWLTNGPATQEAAAKIRGFVIPLTVDGLVADIVASALYQSSIKGGVFSGQTSATGDN